jgi:hypothetical protein
MRGIAIPGFSSLAAYSLLRTNLRRRMMPLGGRAHGVAVTAAATAYACRAKSRSDTDAHLKRTRDEQENYAENLDAMAKKLSEADEYFRQYRR